MYRLSGNTSTLRAAAALVADSPSSPLHSHPTVCKPASISEISSKPDNFSRPLSNRTDNRSAYTSRIRRRWRPKCPSVRKSHNTACSGAGACRVVSEIVAAKRFTRSGGITRYPSRSDGNNTLLKLPAKITSPLRSNPCMAGIGGPE